jgi:hypothetical protein
MTPPPQFFLDRPVARVLAFCVFLACAGALAYLHRADLWPSEARQADADDPFARCFAERAADVDRMLADGVIQEEQAALFKTRAEAMCRATSGSGAPSGDGGPGLPALPAQ